MALEQSHYVLGHTPTEQLRLIRQAQILEPVTERFLRDARIAPGMRVLDIGCGMGDVTMLAAQLVGPTGRIVSVDLDQASLETARKRAAAFGLDLAARPLAPRSGWTSRAADTARDTTCLWLDGGGFLLR